ncbi:LOW QUALITY PROTEIN: hypothetical protein M513_09384 [Trichuris suis]|uniref:Uncharacterized protein n=1 Tax=Trichuris suis TaxID=68888 RepID=A0A085LXJ1_9BILA|nr:LOW QUALITY PROTEIN: hypothetical protein M513_09384 [Trichuris suis]
MDFRELNRHIETFTADSDVCAEKLRECFLNRLEESLPTDLRRPVSLAVSDPLKVLPDTCLGFGLNAAPLIMKAVVNCVLSQDPEVHRGTSAYIDDILVNEDVVRASRVEHHLAQHGLTCKTHERVIEGARVLGLWVWGSTDAWKRDNETGSVPPRLTRRSVFSLCGKLVGHLPVCGWLRVVTALIKRRVNDATSTWDQAIEDDELRMLLQEVVSEARSPDPARGMWVVAGDEARVWVDASSLAIGVALEVDGAIVEDATWLRSDEASHINMAELDAVVKGLNLAISWRMSKIELVTDSSTVHRWITDGLSGKTRLRTKASSEMLIRRRIGIVLSLVQEYSLELSVKLVKSAENKADVLTRVPQRWSRLLGTPAPVCATAIDEVESRIAETHHNSGHPGVRRTLCFVTKVCPSVSRRQVRQVIVGCEACQSIDPAPVRWRRGSLSVEKVWQRVGMDITHYGGRPHLSLIDCGPSRFAIWRPLRLHTGADVVEQLESVFCERGAPEELLTDNDTASRSKVFPGSRPGGAFASGSDAHMSHPGTVSLRGAIGLSKS